MRERMSGRLTYACLAGFHLCANTAVMALSLTSLREAISLSSRPQSQFVIGILLAVSLLAVNISLFALAYRHIARANIRNSVINISLISFIAIIIFDIVVSFFTFAALAGAGGRLGDTYYFLYVACMFLAGGSSAICWFWWGLLIWLARKGMAHT